ncbi:MAG: hypothetical protein CENE_01861 [Candidatus Celerinatantimonas neptuna]|nr:MAG: hypothetical protein CENE_01861 [Candidatus Celerinatantimonas neptuna]
MNAKDQLSGDLLTEIDLRDDDLAECNQNLTDEGVEMAKRVHDMAPDTAISFYAQVWSVLQIRLTICVRQNNKVEPVQTSS